MLVINKDFSWYTIDGMSVQEWINQPVFNGKLHESVLHALDDDNPLYSKIIEAERFEPILDDNGELVDIKQLEV